jgi:ketosteroid isomerase-like protein
MMKRSLAIVTLVILALAVPTLMLAQQNSKAEKEVRAVLDELTQANLKGGTEGAAIFDKYLAVDVTRIPANGAIYNKAEVLDDFRTGKQTVRTYDLSDVKIHIYGNTAVVTGILNNVGAGPLAGDSEMKSRQFRFTRVFVKRGGTWQNVLYQSTLIMGKG